MEGVFGFVTSGHRGGKCEGWISVLVVTTACGIAENHSIVPMDGIKLSGHDFPDLKPDNP